MANIIGKAIENTTSAVRRMRATSVSLVLKPDLNTQLALHVKWQQGHFEALAVLERGDYAALDAEWSQLQNRLAGQGVRLAPLVAGSQPSTSVAGGDFSARRQPGNRASSRDSLKPPMARTHLRKPRATPVPAGSGRDW